MVIVITLYTQKIQCGEEAYRQTSFTTQDNKHIEEILCNNLCSYCVYVFYFLLMNVANLTYTILQHAF